MDADAHPATVRSAVRNDVDAVPVRDRGFATAPREPLLQGAYREFRERWDLELLTLMSGREPGLEEPHFRTVSSVNTENSEGLKRPVESASDALAKIGPPNSR